MNEWHIWRSKGIGSSEVSALMNENAFGLTPFKLYELKLGLTENKETNFAMQRGTEAEPKIRALYELQNGYEVPPTLFSVSENPHFRASLDGYNKERDLVVEFKYPSKEKHAEALSGKIPRCYYAQVQYQIFCANAKKAHYVSYDGTNNLAIVEVLPDIEYTTRLVNSVDNFWNNHILKKVPPELTDEDKKEVDHVDGLKEFSELNDIYIAKSEELKNIEERLELLKSNLVKNISHPKTLCNGYLISKVIRKGNVDYSKIDAIKNIDLEQYRKKTSIYWTVKKII